LRHAKPEVVKAYDIIVEAYHQGPPKCCHTCLHYANDGICVAFFMTPPQDFAASVNQCADWEMDVPF